MHEDRKCPICHGDAKEGPLPTHYSFNCQVCGSFYISLDLVAAIDHVLADKDRYCLSAATRQATEAHSLLRLNTVEDIQGLIELHKRTTVSEKLDKLLAHIARKSGSPGHWVRFDPNREYPIADARDAHEILAYIRHLEKTGAIDSQYHGELNGYCPTIEGWRQLEPVLRPGGEPGRCFVAMWEDNEMDDAYNSGIHPAVHECGYKPHWMKEIQDNKEITNRILSEIRRAEFIVADFTGHRPNVYYEAGFARALGREVISCCRHDHFKDLHFDTKHFGHIVWNDPKELREKLADSIRANIIKKA